MSDVAINQVLAQMRSIASSAGGELGALGSAASGAAEGPSFSTVMQDSIEKVNADMMQAKAAATAFEAGEPGVSLVEVMIASQRASLEFQAMTEVRNKLLSAYQEIMSMQV